MQLNIKIARAFNWSMAKHIKLNGILKASVKSKVMTFLPSNVSMNESLCERLDFTDYDL